ncbi:TonB family protein [Hymenobacter perfusus]|uniref:TonB family protein n=1 Tax=Hymenobacter perfusus TaxID=1236770 RepID=A0A3R9UYC3_9BACT|nr:M56 family metallopeptidase [Hymenobacter perfusus]RSK42750.1 TonB family protein [Hymenobacter perfusus]
MLPPTSTLLSWLGQSTLLLGLAWLFYRQLLRQERCFSYNRRFLLLAPWAAILLPPFLVLLAPWLPTWQAAPAVAQLLYSRVLPVITISADGGAVTGPVAWLPLLYGLGVGLGLSRLLGQVLHLWLTTRRWPRHLRPGYTLVLTGGLRPTGSFGRWVFWDDTAVLTEAEAAQVLRHEVAHARQGHTTGRLALEVARVLLWPCPFVHLFPPALELTHEFLADEAAIRPDPTTRPTSGTTENYAALLARAALRQLHPDLPLTHSFTQSFTLTRIRMLTSHSPVRRWKQRLALPLSLALLGLLACEKAVELPPPPPPALPTNAQLAPPPPPPALLTQEQGPGYPGGQTQLMADIFKLVKYPAVAKDAKVAGSVFVQFIVSEQGLIRNATVVKAPKGPAAAVAALKAEALTAVNNLPGRWTPCQRNGQLIETRYTIPISFALK